MDKKLLKVFLLVVMLSACDSHKKNISYELSNSKDDLDFYLERQKVESKIFEKKDKSTQVLIDECKLGDFISCFQVASLYSHKKDELKANVYFKLACDMGNGKGCMAMGVRSSPFKVQLNPKLALSDKFKHKMSESNNYFYQACEKGDIRGCARLAYIESDELKKISIVNDQSKSAKNHGVIILLHEAGQQFPDQQFRRVLDDKGRIIFMSYYSSLELPNLPRKYDRLSLPAGKYKVVVECKGQDDRFPVLVKSQIVLGSKERIQLSCRQIQNSGYSEKQLNNDSISSSHMFELIELN